MLKCLSITYHAVDTIPQEKKATSSQRRFRGGRIKRSAWLMLSAQDSPQRGHSSLAIGVRKRSRLLDRYRRTAGCWNLYGCAGFGAMASAESGQYYVPNISSPCCTPKRWCCPAGIANRCAALWRCAGDRSRRLRADRGRDHRVSAVISCFIQGQHSPHRQHDRQVTLGKRGRSSGKESVGMKATLLFPKNSRLGWSITKESPPVRDRNPILHSAPVAKSGCRTFRTQSGSFTLAYDIC